MSPANVLAHNLGNDIYQLVDCDKLVRAKIKRLAIIRLHNAIDAFDAIIDIHERTGLFAIAPNLYFFVVADRRDLPTDRSRRLLTPPFIGAERPIDVVESY